MYILSLKTHFKKLPLAVSPITKCIYVALYLIDKCYALYYLQKACSELQY